MSVRILCLGDACMDVLLPSFDTLNGRPGQPTAVCGGSVANTAAGLGRLGAACAFCGVAGDDEYGRTMRGALARDGVDVSLFELRPGLESSVVLICLEEGGERVPFLLPRERHAYLQLCAVPDGVLRQFSLVHTTGMMLFDEPTASAVCATLERCRALGVHVSLDLNVRVESLGKDTRLLRRAIDCADYLLGSEREELLPLAQTGTAASLAPERRTVIARQGAEGASVCTPQGVSHCPAFPTEVVDTVGAGDVFHGAYIYAWLQGWDAKTCCRFCSGVSAIKCTRPGGRSGIPTLPFLEKFLATGEIDGAELDERVRHYKYGLLNA